MCNLDSIVEAMNDLFVTVRYKYIKQTLNGDYTTFNQHKSDKVFPFNDSLLKLHLQHKETYGIFSRSEDAKFISFDVDVKEIAEGKRAVYALYEVLQSFGIPKDFIFTSNSGNKGYHVDIYFNRPISIKILEKFYNFTLREVNNLLGDNFEGQIELRPRHNLGMKLPLGINWKNPDKDTRICWYVDVENGFKPICSLDYILTVKKINSDIIIDLLEEAEDKKETSIKTNALMSKNSNIAYSNIDFTNETIASLQKLYNEGLKFKGTRHTSLLKLAVYFYNLGLNQQECEEKLFEWLKAQNRQLYETPLAECRKEISRMTRWAFENNVSIFTESKTVKFSKNEIKTILQCNKTLRLVLFSLFAHSKRFNKIDGQFFMTYEQLSEATGLSVRTVITHVSRLEREGKIKVARNPVFYNGEAPRCKPNIYRILIEFPSADDSPEIEADLSDISKYRNIYLNLLISMFSINELSSSAVLK